MASMGFLYFSRKTNDQWPMTNERIIVSSGEFVSRDLLTTWVCLNMVLYYDLWWFVPQWSSHFAKYISRHSQLQNPRSCSSGSTIPCTICVQRRKRRCSSESEIRSVQVSWKIQWIGLRNLLQKTHRNLPKWGFLSSIDFTWNRLWDLQMEKNGVHTPQNANVGKYMEINCWNRDLLFSGKPKTRGFMDLIWFNQFKSI